MFVAASQGNREILHYLKSHGADVNAEWTLDRALSETALGATILAGDVRGTQLLLHHGADPDIKNASGVSVRQQSRGSVGLRTLIEQAKPAPKLLSNRLKPKPRRPAMMNFDGRWSLCIAFARCRSSTNSASVLRYPKRPFPGLHRLYFRRPPLRSHPATLRSTKLPRHLQPAAA
jgi:ankyrin repeat protein